MALTKAQFRTRVREMIGDPLRVSGTATGGSLTTILDTSKLNQADNFWTKLQAFIVTTTNGAAPQGEAKRIAASSGSNYRVTVEMPFSATVESGDTYGIAIFSNAYLDNLIANTLLEFSEYRPVKFSESLSVGGGEKRYSPTSAATIRYVTKIEEYSAAARKDIVYRNWVWNDDTKKIEFSDWQTTAKTLTLYAAKSHTLPSGESDALTYEAVDEANLLLWCAANAIIALSEQQAHDAFGNIRPNSITRGPISEVYGDQREKIVAAQRDVIAKIKEQYTVASSSFSTTLRLYPGMNQHGIDRSAIWLNH